MDVSFLVSTFLIFKVNDLPDRSPQERTGSSKRRKLLKCSVLITNLASQRSNINFASIIGRFMYISNQWMNSNIMSVFHLNPLMRFHINKSFFFFEVNLNAVKRYNEIYVFWASDFKSNELLAEATHLYVFFKVEMDVKKWYYQDVCILS